MLTYFLRYTGAVVASYQLMITIGILVSKLINYGVREIEDTDASWRIVIGLGIGFSIPLGIGVLFLPESPRWLILTGREKEALKVLSALNDKSMDSHEVRQVRNEL